MSAYIKNYLLLEQELEKISHLNNIATIVSWDVATNLPVGSHTSRSKETATLSGLIHEMSISSKIKELLGASYEEINDLNPWQKANLNLAKRAYDRQVCISSDIRHELSICTSECEFVWRKCRADNDFKTLIPYLDHVFNITRRAANIWGSKLGKKPMDALIDLYDPGRECTEIEATFQIIKSELPTLIQEIASRQEGENFMKLPGFIDESMQRAIGIKIMEKMEFDMSRGRLDKSIHPFSTGTREDTRLTTRYDENNFLSGLFGIIHETGHGLYQQNLPVSYSNQPVGQPLGMSFHESQSLIMEMQAGTSRQFIEFLARLLRDEFGFLGAEYSADNIYKSVTKVKPGFIRVDADEVTYPMHIILRFEIEKEIIENDLKAVELPSLWRRKMQQYMGIEPDNDSRGCMQDIHWPSGALGYFPAYTNGAITAAMLMRSAKSKYPDIEKRLSKGCFSNLNRYLNENLRQTGSSKSSNELLMQSTGYENLQPRIFIDYLKSKYL